MMEKYEVHAPVLPRVHKFPGFSLAARSLASLDLGVPDRLWPASRSLQRRDHLGLCDSRDRVGSPRPSVECKTSPLAQKSCDRMSPAATIRPKPSTDARAIKRPGGGGSWPCGPSDGRASPSCGGRYRSAWSP